MTTSKLQKVLRKLLHQNSDKTWSYAELIAVTGSSLEQVIAAAIGLIREGTATVTYPASTANTASPTKPKRKGKKRRKLKRK